MVWRHVLAQLGVGCGVWGSLAPRMSQGERRATASYAVRSIRNVATRAPHPSPHTSRLTTSFLSGQNAMIATPGNRGRGKSELHRADRQVTPGRRKATDRVTESKPPMAQLRARKREPMGTGKGETVG